MKKALRILLICLICIASLGAMYIGFVFMIASGFIFAGDIDLTEEQRKAAEIWVIIGSIFGVFVMIISLFAMLGSKVISEFILKLFGINFSE